MDFNPINRFLTTGASEFAESLLKGDINQILVDEKRYYHSVCKNPDDELQFFRFYSIIENWHMITAGKIQLKNSAISSKNKQLIVNLKNLLVFKLCQSPELIILRGTIDLANGAILESVLEKLDSYNRKKITLCLVDYTHTQTQQICAEYNIRGIGLSNSGINEADKLSIIFDSIINTQAKRAVNICFWSIPFGMIYLYYSLKLAGHNGDRTFTSTKYGYTFSDLYLTKLLTGVGMSEYTKRYHIHSEIQHIGYTQKSLRLGDISALKYQLQTELTNIKAKNNVIWSSMARSEKLISSHYLEVLNHILMQSQLKSTYLLCGRQIPNEYKKFISDNPSSIKFIGWRKLNSLINYIDLYVDPFPHGGGFSLALALGNKIPSIIPCLSSSKHSPSLIQALLPHLTNIEHQIGEHNFRIMFPKTTDEVIESILMLINDKSKLTRLKECSRIVYNFLISNDSHNAKLALGIKD